MERVEAIALIGDHGFSRTQAGRIGVELEWVVVDPADPGRRLPPAEVTAALGEAATSLPHGGKISFEPGGQLELSTQPAPDLAECLRQAAAEVEVIQQRLRRAGWELSDRALDTRPARRIVDHPRYELLEVLYDRYGPVGRIMMCNTAAVQINLDAGDESGSWSGRERRWQLVNRLGPVLTAIFANSPAPAPDRCRSFRQVLRFTTDRTRTDPVILQGNSREEWARYTLAANVVAIADPHREGERPMWSAPPAGLTLGGWLDGDGPRPVRHQDVLNHLKTVIPPVRACGHLEIRMIDAQPGGWWAHPVAVVAALLDDPEASDALVRLLSGVPLPAHRRDWVAAACRGLSDPALAELATDVMGIARKALGRMGCPEWVTAGVDEFAERFTNTGRCPSDVDFR